MKVEIEFKDLDEFSKFLDAMSHAGAAYKRTIDKIFFCCNDTTLDDTLEEKYSNEELRERYMIYRQKYKELLDKETNLKYDTDRSASSE